MDKASDVAHQQTDSRSIRSDCDSGSTTSQAALRRAAGVWDAMTQMFGSSFVTIYGETPTQLWVRSIAELSDDECVAGIERIRKERREYPCNLTEFVEACRPKAPGRRYLGTPICGSEADTPQLEQQPAEREHIDACLASMRRKLSESDGPAKQAANPAPADDEAPELLDGTALESERNRQLNALLELQQSRQPGSDDE